MLLFFFLTSPLCVLFDLLPVEAAAPTAADQEQQQNLDKGRLG